MKNPFWNYSLALYSKPAVAELCLLAQDRYGVEVNFLLYAAWLSSRGQSLNAFELKRLLGATEQWRQEVIGPLRSLRRQWRSLPEAAQLRTQLQGLELEAERYLQDLLWLDYQAAPPVLGADLRANLQQVLACHMAHGADLEQLLEQLLDVLEP